MRTPKDKDPPGVDSMYFRTLKDKDPGHSSYLLPGSECADCVLLHAESSERKSGRAQTSNP
eukprot:scaffold14210_cov122-Skeletonema_dohrnii-CCMP3373.AAC.3